MKIGHPEDPTPLSTQSFYVMLAVATEQDNAYALMSKIEEDSGGTLRMAPGSLYPALQRLTQAGYIEQGGPMPSRGRLGSTRVYRLSDIGKMVLGWELDRYERAINLGRERLRMV